MRYVKYCLVAVMGMVCFTYLSTPKAHAVTASDWSPGRIIDDSVFQNKDSMTVAQIQQFLDSKVPVCDTWGAQPMWAGGPTRAQWSADNGKDLAPYTCLKDYVENPNTKENNGDDPRKFISGGLSAAQLIYNASQAQNINPQVFLVLLQKEQSLVTDDWPYAKQFERATGNNCPDTAPCNPAYAWLWTQVNNAGAQFNYYVNNFDQFNYAPGWNNILYNPNTACGRQSVFIENAYTAALYIYTPYVPNQAALNNMYGTGDGCSAYGNRNFWRMFNDWFGPSTSIENIFSINVTSQPTGVLARGQQITYTMTITNKLSYPVSVNAIGVVGRGLSLNGGSNRDLGWQGPYTINPSTPLTVTFSGWAADIGKLYLWPTILYGNRYIHYENLRSTLDVRQANLSLETVLTPSNQRPVSGETVTYNAVVKNNEVFPVRVDAIGIPVKYYGVYSYDTAWTMPSGGVLQPGSTISLSGAVLHDKEGPYNSWVSWNMGGIYSTIGNQINIGVVRAVPNFSLTYIETPNQNPFVGEQIVIKFKLKNNLNVPFTLDAVGIVGRYDNPYVGKNRDFGWVGPVAFTAGEEKSFTTFSSTVTNTGTFFAWVAYQKDGNYRHYNNWGFALNARKPVINLQSATSISSITNLNVGQSNNFQYTIKNTESKPIALISGLRIRYYDKYIYDTPTSTNVVLSPAGTLGDTYTYSVAQMIDKPGPYSTEPFVKIGDFDMTLGPKQIQTAL